MSRILMVSHDAYLYGAQRSLLDIALELIKAGHQVDVCVPESGALAEKLRANHVRVRIAKFGRWIPGASSRPLLRGLKVPLDVCFGILRAYRLLQSDRYDAVYTNTVTVLDFAIAAKLRRVPHIWHLRESVEGNPQLLSILSNRSIIWVVRRLSNRVVYNSHHLLARYGDGATKKDVVIHNGVQSRPARPDGVQRYPDAKCVVVTVGFMQQGKGLDVLLDALLLLAKNLRERVVLRVVGDIDKGYMAQEIAPRIAKLGETVELLGWLDGLDEVINNADLLVSSSHSESFGRTLVEAMMAGVAVLATRSGGPEEIVIDGVTGLLVPPNDPQRLSDGLSYLMENPTKLDTFGRAGRERALAHFSLHHCTGKVERCVAQMIFETE